MTERKNYDYFRKLRRSDPKLYMTKKVQAEMHRQAIRQGESFYQSAPKPAPIEPDFESRVPSAPEDQETLQQEEETE